MYTYKDVTSVNVLINLYKILYSKKKKSHLKTKAAKRKSQKYIRTLQKRDTLFNGKTEGGGTPPSPTLALFRVENQRISRMTADASFSCFSFPQERQRNGRSKEARKERGTKKKKIQIIGKGCKNAVPFFLCLHFLFF